MNWASRRALDWPFVTLSQLPSRPDADQFDLLSKHISSLND